MVINRSNLPYFDNIDVIHHNHGLGSACVVTMYQAPATGKSL